MQDLKIVVGAVYQCRNGSRARVLATDGRGGHPIVGLVQTSGASDKLQRWKRSGKCFDYSQEAGHDLIEMLSEDLSTGFSMELDDLKTKIADASALSTIECCCRGVRMGDTVYPIQTNWNLRQVHDEGDLDAVERAGRYLRLRGMIEPIDPDKEWIVRLYSSPSQRLHAINKPA